MRRHRFYPAWAVTVLLLSPVLTLPALAQDFDAAAAAVQPTPRFSDGQVNLQVLAGEKGVWNRQDYRLILAETEEQTADRDLRGGRDDGPPGLKPKFSEVPFQPWAESLFIYRQTHEIEPYTRCKPAGGARNMATPYGTEFVQARDEQRIFIFQTGGPHSFRPIYMDGRAHPEDLDPSYYGHSVGRWEGDVLVIDTVGFNERGWIGARGAPTTKQLHLVERISRPDYDTLRYEITIDDPGAYTAPWTTGMMMSWTPDREQFEYICQDGNLASELMIGAGNTVIDRGSRIVP